jgi:predicted transglutaminase-like cysteine proteinase
MGFLAALGGCTTMAAPVNSGFMALGEAAPAPIGFLDFCARRPQDCRASAPDRLGAGVQMAQAGAPARLIRTSATGPAASAAVIDAGLDRSPGLARAMAMAAGSTDDRPAVDGPDAPLRLSPGLVDRLEEINDRINGAIKPMSDMATHGVPDHWDLPLEEGDPRGDCEDYALEKQRTLINEGFPAEALSIAVVTTRWGEEHAVLIVSTDGGDFVLDNLTPRVRAWRDVNYYKWIERQAPGQPLTWVVIAGAARASSAG